MEKRLKSLDRLLQVQRQMQGVEERKLTQVQRRKATLEAQREDLIAAMNRNPKLYGSFVFAMARQMRSLDREIERLKEEEAMCSKRLLEQAGRKKTAERLYDTITRDWRRAVGRKELLDLIDQAVGPTDASLP